MPFDAPNKQAVEAAYGEIVHAADATPFAATDDPADALARIEAVLREGTDGVSATLQFRMSEQPSEDDLAELRELATNYAGRVVSALRSASQSAALGVMAPTRDRLPSLVQDFGRTYESMQVEMLGEHPNNTLVEQFATPLMGMGTLDPRTRPQSEGRLRASYGVIIGAAARLIAVIDERPELRRDWD